ncbi:MAG: ATP-binding protein [Chloroflexi bacterium]|nr:MAG: ATP-binding protein [Chloroflexota bacterium]
MPTPTFIARERELALLHKEWETQNACLLILYGRRRVGKTRLLTHWIEKTGHRALYWVAAPTSTKNQLRSFSQALFNFEGSGVAADNFSYQNWEQAFEQAARMAESERLVLVLDEFTYLLPHEPGIAGILQNAWDHRLKNTNIFVIVTGSHIGMMERDVLAPRAPLYGRATSLLHLQPLPFANTRSFFPKYRPDERVAVYSMLGGVPAYWERFNPKLSLDRNIKDQFLGGANLIMNEPSLLLHDYVSDIHNYAAILQAIAHGNRTPATIGSAAGLNSKHIPQYLRNLIRSGFVERRIPVTKSAASRSGHHHITDPFLRFYYRFLSSRQSQLAAGVQDQTLAQIKKHLVDFIGTYTWEELCREWLLRATGQKVLPFLPDHVGSAWTAKAQIDVAGINRMEKTLILGECKWTRQASGRGVLAGLTEKTNAFVPAQGQWQVYFLGFAREGWTQAAQEFAASVSKDSVSGPNWQAQAMDIYDLAQVDGDLESWTN